MKKLLIPIIVFIVIGIHVNAQEKSCKESKGDKYSFNYSYDKAIECYTHAKQLSTEGQRRLAESYHNTDKNILAEEVYSKLITAQAEIIPEDYYNYAMVLKINGKYDLANQFMDKFRQQKPDDLRAKDYAANYGELTNLLKDDGKYKIDTLNVNTVADDFGTCYYLDKIVFSSTRSTPGMVVRKYNWTQKPYWDMYVSDVADGQLKTPEKFDNSLNGKMHDGPASFSKDGTFMAFTRNNYNDKSKDRVVELQIYFSRCTDGKWSKPEPFVLNNSEYSVGQPCLTSDGNTMYFISDMPGGYGGSDIYRIAQTIKGEWGKPDNMGDKINTEGDELFPFFEENNDVLFFASNGRFGLGGLDIFISVAEGCGFRVYNAGAPLNTQYDDFALIANDKLNKGYFSSNRSGGSGGDDIYSVEFLKVDTAQKAIAIVEDTLTQPLMVAITPTAVEIMDAEVRFQVNAPKNIPVERRVRETFPLRNYVFFNKGSTAIPDRYELLTKDQVKSFKEDQLEVFTPKNLSGRSKRQMTAYYNILNILGDRMGKNPLATVTLVGSSGNGPIDGKEMAVAVKQYLVDIFGIDAKRISIEGRDKPKIPSEKPGFTQELDLLREGDQRVSIESSSPALLMEFQSGPDAPLKPVEINTVQEAPLDSYVTFSVSEGKDPITSWSLEIKDDKGRVQNFGPYTQEKISLPGKSIMAARPEGDYLVAMIGQTKSGSTIRKETSVHMVLWTPPQNEEMMRFSIIYEFNDSRAILIYDKYLTEVVIPKIPKGSKVIISGYTDIVGEEAHNQTLSLARANDARRIIEKGLSKAGRSDVTFVVNAFGENQLVSPFENKFPEERFYNRTVIIDIIPSQNITDLLTR